MRKPRNIDAELKALSERAARLKAKKLMQLGEMAAATGADALEPEVLAGLLLHGVAANEPAKAEWRRAGARFFQNGQGKEIFPTAPSDRSGPGQGSGSDPKS